MTVRAGVIGVGYLGRHHARIYSEIEDAQLVAVADTDMAAAEQIARTYGCKAFSDYRQMLGLCDAVSIVTPTTLHYRVAMDCIDAGVDLLVEKPITAEISEAMRIVEAAGKKNLILQVGHLERYNPGLLAASDMIADPRFIESRRLSPFMGRADDVDVTFDLMIHDIDIVLSLAQSPLADIRAVGGSMVTNRIDITKAWLEFENGCIAVITASRLETEKVRTLRLFQKDTVLMIDYQKQELTRQQRADNRVTTERIQPESREPLKEEIRDFVRCVLTRQEPRVSGIVALNALEVALKINGMVGSNRKQDRK